MAIHLNESQFSYKELNKILPSYLLEEIREDFSFNKTLDETNYVSNNILLTYKLLFNLE